jgi:hypothetical protein
VQGRNSTNGGGQKLQNLTYKFLTLAAGPIAVHGLWPLSHISNGVALPLPTAARRLLLCRRLQLRLRAATASCIVSDSSMHHQGIIKKYKWCDSQLQARGTERQDMICFNPTSKVYHARHNAPPKARKRYAHTDSVAPYLLHVQATATYTAGQAASQTAAAVAAARVCCAHLPDLLQLACRSDSMRISSRSKCSATSCQPTGVQISRAACVSSHWLAPHRHPSITECRDSVACAGLVCRVQVSMLAFLLQCCCFTTFSCLPWWPEALPGCPLMRSKHATRCTSCQQL